MAKTYELVVYDDDGKGVTSAITEYDRDDNGVQTYVGRAWLGVEETAAAVAVLTRPCAHQRWTDFLEHRDADGENHIHQWHPAGFTPHPVSGGLMPTDRCACGAVRYPYSPEVAGGGR